MRPYRPKMRIFPSARRCGTPAMPQKEADQRPEYDGTPSQFYRRVDDIVNNIL